LIWQRRAAHRTRIARNSWWRSTPRAASGHNERWQRTTPVPTMILEPESGWWQAQDELDGCDEPSELS
jgi:hypothetical protein